MNPTPRFLSVDDVQILHAIAIEDQGGDPTLCDRAMLESAVALPSQQFEGRYLHEDIPAMAAAYAFHICQNHPFLDGNKRAAAAAMIAFLSDNGWSFDTTADEAEQAFIRLAAGAMDKGTFTQWARQHMHEKPKMELREFFARIDPHEFTKRIPSMLPAVTGAASTEFQERVKEAEQAMPLLRELARQQQVCRDEHDDESWGRITMLAVGMMALHSLAEDMGYEW